MISAFTTLYPPILSVCYESVGDYIERINLADIDLLVYYAHQLDTAVCDEVAVLKRAVEQRPIVLLSDASESESLDVICEVLRNGANGYVCTRTSSLAMALAALLFVQAGGTFAPVELLLDDDAPVLAAKEQAHSERLTGRQMNVLALIRQGKANKVIAEALGMSESAVKVHIRNIMRKMGVTNRTQAAFAAMDQLKTGGPMSKRGISTKKMSAPTPPVADEESEGDDAWSR